MSRRERDIRGNSELVLDIVSDELGTGGDGPSVLVCLTEGYWCGQVGLSSGVT